MRMSDLFDDYVQRIKASEAELASARAHRDNVAKRLGLVGVVEVINSGSYIKKTAIKPFNDIDLFVGFDHQKFDSDPKRIINELADHLKQTFSERARPQRHSVGITFSDMRVDVVPGFKLANGGGYRIRNRLDDKWVETDIHKHKDFFKRRQDRDPRHRQVIQLVKAWKRNRRLRIGSYLMELLVSKCFDQDGIPQGKDRALHTFFEWMALGGLREPVVFGDFYPKRDAKRVNAPLVVLDPTNPKNNVGGEMTDSAVAELESVADKCRARAGTALAETSRSRAAAIWRELLPAFPNA